ncbi:trifunctional histidinol dehydrogenase [Recurvomyces mirabilis]|nr:trifunctional histidinol dehydrogenase [Recurvomyces mirabilis]
MDALMMATLTEQRQDHDLNWWIRFELWIHGQVHGKVPPLNEDTERPRLTQAWARMGSTFRNEIGPAFNAWNNHFQQSRAVLESGKARLAEPPQLQGSNTDGWRYPEDFTDVAEQQLLVLTQAWAKVLAKGADQAVLATSVGWVQGRIDRHQKSTTARRARIERHQEAIWRMVRGTLHFDETWVGGWVGGWRLGKGGWGGADLWVRQSAANTVADVRTHAYDLLYLDERTLDMANKSEQRIVLKASQSPDCDDPNTGTVNWWDGKEQAEFWCPDPRDPSRILPNEIMAMYSLRNRIGSEGVVHIRNFKLVPLERRVLLYLECCPYGDLSQFTGWYDEQIKYFRDDDDKLWRGFHKRRERLHEKERTEKGWLPEPFLWHVLECLIKTGIMLDKGELMPHPISKFDSILHLDIKTPNIFLGTNTSGTFAGYPYPKLGDFGLCIMPSRLKTQRSQDPWEQKVRGTRFNMSPEHCLIRFDDEDQPRIMDSKTNVWAVGNILWSLIEGEEGDHRVEWDFGKPWTHYDEENIREPTFRAAAVLHYSVGLIKTIQSALRYDPLDRPSFEELLREVRERSRGTAGVRAVRDLGKEHRGWKNGPYSLDKFMGQTWDFGFGVDLGGKELPRILGDDDEDVVVAPRIPPPSAAIGTGARGGDDEEEGWFGGAPSSGIRPATPPRPKLLHH